MLTEIDYYAILVDENVERDASAGVKDRIQPCALLFCQMICFDHRMKRVYAVGVVVEIEIDDA